MEDGTPDPTDPTWQHLFNSSPDSSATGGFVMDAAPQPEFDPDEPWVDLPELKKVPAGAVFDLVQELRKAGVPVRGGAPRRAGPFSGGRVNVTLSVPERQRAQAGGIVDGCLGGR